MVWVADAELTGLLAAIGVSFSGSLEDKRSTLRVQLGVGF